MSSNPSSTPASGLPAPPTVFQAAIRGAVRDSRLILFYGICSAGYGFANLVFARNFRAGLMYLAGGIVIPGLIVLARALFKRVAYIEQARDEVIQGVQQAWLDRLKQLEREINDCRNIPGAYEMAQAAASQFDHARQVRENFHKLLSRRLETTELTFNRFSTGAEEVFRSLLDNLALIAERLQAVRTIDPEFIRSRIDGIEMEAKRNQGQLAETDRSELQILKDRLALRDKQIQAANALITENEKSLAILEKFGTAVIEMKTSSGFSSTALEETTAELEELARRVRKLGNSV